MAEMFPLSGNILCCSLRTSVRPILSAEVPQISVTTCHYTNWTILYGMYLPWLQSEFGMSQKTANNFVHVAERFKDKLVKFTNLSSSVLYLLASTIVAVLSKQARWLRHL